MSGKNIILDDDDDDDDDDIKTKNYVIYMA